MRKGINENKSLSSIKTPKRKFEGVMRAKLAGGLKVSKVFIMNSGLQSISAKERKNGLLNKSDEGLAAIKGGGSCLTPDDLLKVQVGKTGGFVEGFERKLNRVKFQSGSGLVRGCIELIEVLAKEDFLFRALLMKVKEQLVRVEKELMEGVEKNFSFRHGAEELRRNGKEKVNGKEVKIEGKTFFPSSSKLPTSAILKSHNFLIQSPEIFFPSDHKQPDPPPNRQSKIIPKSQSSPKHKAVNFQSLHQELTDLKAKDLKYQLLITALKNRGYPVDEVYQFDVHQPVKSGGNPQQLFNPSNLSLTSEESDLEDELHSIGN